MFYTLSTAIPPPDFRFQTCLGRRELRWEGNAPSVVESSTSPVILRAPLFPAALLFAGGCWAGTWPAEIVASWPEWIYGGVTAALFILGLLWWRGPRAGSGVSFSVLLLLGGWWSGWSSQVWWRVDDLRQLLPRLEDPSARWRGRIDSLPEAHASSVQFYLQLQGLTTDSIDQPVSGRLLVRLRHIPEPCPIEYGQTISLSGLPQPPMTARNPGQLDYRRYLEQHEVYEQLTGEYSEVRILQPATVWNPFHWAAQAREWARGRLTLGLTNDPTVTAILTGMLFGETDQIPQEIINAFRITGTYHIFAVSGQNLAELLGLGLFTLQALGGMRWRWGWILAPALIFFCLVSDNQPSIIRALIMALLVLLAWRIGRPLSPRNLWGATLLVILASNPWSVRDPGFMLSFVVVLSLLLLAGPLVHWMEGPWLLDPFIIRRLAPSCLLKREEIGRAASSLMGTSLAAWLGSTPLMALWFHQISGVAILANLFVVPLAGLIVVVGTLSVLVGLVLPPLTLIFNNANWLAVQLLLAGVLPLSHWPGGNVYIPDPEAWESTTQPHLTLAQTGSSTLVLLRYRGQNWLFNTGSENDYQFVLNPMRKYYGINHWNGIILTDFSAGACGGAPSLAMETGSTQWWVPSGRPRNKKFQRFWLDLHSHTISHSFRYPLDRDCSLSIFPTSPPEGGNAALLILLEYHGQRFLDAGSLSFVGERQLIKVPGLPNVQVLFQSANPQEPNLSKLWLAGLSPQHLIKTARSSFLRGRDLSAEPNPSGVSYHLWNQSETGAISVILRDQTVEIHPFLNLLKNH